jgi:hypothetical protein
VSQEVGVGQKEALYLGMLAESYWTSGFAAKTIEALARAAEVGEGATLSHPLVMMQLGAWEQAGDLLVRFRDADPDPDRRAVGRLSLARIRWWQGDEESARTLCSEALELLSPTPLPSHILPAEALMACLDRQPSVAIASLRAAGAHCSPAIYDEIATDVGTYFAEADDIPAPIMATFLDATKRPMHCGVKYQLHWLRSRMFAKLHQPAREREDAFEASVSAQAIARQLDGDYLETFLTNPWVRNILPEAAHDEPA